MILSQNNAAKKEKKTIGCIRFLTNSVVKHKKSNHIRIFYHVCLNICIYFQHYIKYHQNLLYIYEPSFSFEIHFLDGVLSNAFKIIYLEFDCVSGKSYDGFSGLFSVFFRFSGKDVESV